MLLILHISVTSQIVQYPIITKIGEQKVVIWTLEQDKMNSQKIEDGNYYYKQFGLLQKDTSDLRSAIRISNDRILNKDSQIEELSFRYGNQIIATNKAVDASNKWKDMYDSEKKKKGFWKVAAPVAGGLGLIVGGYLGLSLRNK